MDNKNKMIKILKILIVNNQNSKFNQLFRIDQVLYIEEKLDLKNQDKKKKLKE